jgi:hypothetical protein
MAQAAPTTGSDRRRVGLVCLLAVCLLPGCKSQKTKPDDSADELVGSPVRPGSAEAEQSDKASDAETDDSPVRRGALWYRLALDDEQLEVRVRLLKPARRTSFFMPDSQTGGSAIERAFTIGGARGPDGTLPVEQFPDQGRIDVETEGLEWVELDYRVDLTAFPERNNRARPEYTDGNALVYAPDVLAVPSKQVVSSIREIPIEIHAPKDWRLFATWPARETKASLRNEGRRVDGFVAEDVRSLRDAFFVAGRDLEAVRRSTDGDDQPVTIAYGPGLQYDRQSVADLVARTVGIYREQFGSVGPVLAYFRSGSGDDDSGVRGTAKRRGLVVGVDRQEADPAETALLVAHEAFHLWNGHELVPSPTHEKETRWFKEGATHYMALKTLYRAGILDHDGIRRELARSAFFYRRNPATRGERASALDLHRLPYDRGLLLALTFDAALARCTDARASIADWIGELLAGDERFYDPNMLRRSFDRVAGRHCSSGSRVWRRFVEHEARLEPSRIFSDVGLHLIEARTLEDTRVLPVDGRNQLYQTLFSRPARHADDNRAASRQSPNSDAEHTDE